MVALVRVRRSASKKERNKKGTTPGPSSEEEGGKEGHPALPCPSIQRSIFASSTGSGSAPESSTWS